MFQSDDETDFVGFTNEELRQDQPGSIVGDGDDAAPPTATAKWGHLEGLEVVSKVDKIYLKVSRWQRNLFYLPTGKVGEDFIAELSRIFNLFASGSPFETIAFTMATIVFPLVLQKPAPNSRTADHKKYTEKRLLLWKRMGSWISYLVKGVLFKRGFLARRKLLPEERRNALFS